MRNNLEVIDDFVAESARIDRLESPARTEV